MVYAVCPDCGSRMGIPGIISTNKMQKDAEVSVRNNALRGEVWFPLYCVNRQALGCGVVRWEETGER